LLQLLCLIAMEPPATFDAGPVRDEKNKVMHAIRPFDPARVREAALRGQYGPGFAGGKPVPGYLQEKGVAPDSKTETYAALRLLVDNWRWAGVPFYLRTGKRLAKRVSEIAIRFHRTPHMIFRRSPAGVEANTLVIRIQPDEGIALTVAAKTPRPELRLGPVRPDFRYGDGFGGEPPGADERRLPDADLQRRPGLLVDLGRAAALAARRADVPRAVGLERRAQRAAQAGRFGRRAIAEARRLGRGRLDDRRLAGAIREPLRDGDVF